jgi:SAM-dependent methyltransferase
MRHMQPFDNTIQVYRDTSFAQMYFDKWRYDLPTIHLEAFAKALGIGRKILDAGCGPGHHSNFLHGLGHSVVGIDLSLEALRIARKFYLGPDFLQIDMRTTPFPESSFDGIWACASAMHLPAALFPAQLSEFRRLLCEDGLLALTMTVEDKAHTDSFGRFFESYSKAFIESSLNSSSFEVLSSDFRRRAKTTEGDAPTARWVTISARKRGT